MQSSEGEGLTEEKSFRVSWCESGGVGGSGGGIYWR